jgi:hypothetical protein
MIELSTEIIDYISKDEDLVFVDIDTSNVIIDIRDMGVRIAQDEEE